MQSYITESLSRDEKLIYATRPHWIIFLPSIFIIFSALIVFLYLPKLMLFDHPLWHGLYFYQLAAIFVLLTGVFSLLGAYVIYASSEYGITNKRIIMKQGVIQRRTTEIFLSKIESINISQSIMGRISGYGGIIIVGTGGTTDYYNNVPNPVHFRNLVQQRLA